MIHNKYIIRNKYGFLVKILCYFQYFLPKGGPHKREILSINAPCWSATSCSTDSSAVPSALRGLNSGFRNGTRCASPAMVLTNRVFLFHEGFSRALRAAQCDVKFRLQNRISSKYIKEKRRARPISSARLNASTYICIHQPRSRGLTEKGKLILGWASRLDAFSGYPDRTQLPGNAIG